MKNDNAEQFLRDVSSLGIVLNDLQLDQFAKYYELLIQWNEKVNLTAITEYNDVMKKHFVDSLSLVKVCNLKEDLSLLDVGTGAGFPGLVLKIAFPDLQVVLMDALNKRVHFLREVIGKLDLRGVEAVHGRAEDFARQEGFREKFDICVSRAVANLSTLSEYCIPFVKLGGCFVSYKSEKTLEEMEEGEYAISLLGGVVEHQTEFYLPDSDIYRNLVTIRKQKNTPEKYPRKAGLPLKKPLSK